MAKRGRPVGDDDPSADEGGSDGDDRGEGPDRGDSVRAMGVALGAGALGFLGTVIWSILLVNLAVAYVGGPLTQLHLVLLSPPVGGLGMLTGAVAYLQLADRDVSFLDLSAPGLRDVVYVVAGLVALFAALELIAIVYAEFQVTTAEHGTADAIRGADATTVAYLVVAALVFIGPGEELLFRNVIQKRLYEDFSRYGAIVVASGIFALVHYNAYSTGTIGEALASLVVVFALSLLLGWIYHRTDSVVVPAVVHGAYDAIVFVSIYLGAA